MGREQITKRQKYTSSCGSTSLLSGWTLRLLFHINSSVKATWREMRGRQASTTEKTSELYFKTHSEKRSHLIFFLSCHFHTDSNASWTSVLSATAVSLPHYNDQTHTARLSGTLTWGQTDKQNVVTLAAHPFSFPPGGGSTRAALGRKGDFGERDGCDGEAVGPSSWLSESLLFFSWAWPQRWDVQGPNLKL